MSSSRFLNETCSLTKRPRNSPQYCFFVFKMICLKKDITDTETAVFLLVTNGTVTGVIVIDNSTNQSVCRAEQVSRKMGLSEPESLVAKKWYCQSLSPQSGDIWDCQTPSHQSQKMGLPEPESKCIVTKYGIVRA